MPVEWQPVLLGGLFRANGRSSWARADPDRRREGMAEIERRAERYGLPPIRWPDEWPTDYLGAMRVATYARRERLTREYARAAGRAAFAEGRDLADVEVALDVASSIGLDRERVREAIASREVKDELRAATDAAHARGVFGVPTVAVGGELFWGDDRLEDAVAALS